MAPGGLFRYGGSFPRWPAIFGMKTATAASSRTAQAASESLSAGLTVAFRSGSGHGAGGCRARAPQHRPLVCSSAHLYRGGGDQLVLITTTLLTFAMGASLQALFARVGGVFIHESS